MKKDATLSSSSAKLEYRLVVTSAYQKWAAKFLLRISYFLGGPRRNTFPSVYVPLMVFHPYQKRGSSFLHSKILPFLKYILRLAPTFLENKDIRVHRANDYLMELWSLIERSDIKMTYM